jgi:hypothetical protein
VLAILIYSAKVTKFGFETVKKAFYTEGGVSTAFCAKK